VKFIILRGVPGSGKSTHAMALQAEGYTRVNRDDIRFALYSAYWGKGVDEEVVTRVENAAIEGALARGADVVLDATNLRAKNLNAKLSIANLYDAEVEFRDFPISLAEAVARDAARDRTVGEAVIARMFKNYRINTVTGILPKAPYILPTFEPYARDTSKVKAFIVDTDGTMANGEGLRGWFDTHLYHVDVVHEHVQTVVRAAQKQGFEIVALSGRDDEFRDVSLTWWKDVAGINPDLFLMRPKGDKRMDAIVKYELFKAHVEPNYNVLGAFDDRPQVLRMWRKLGIPTFTIGTGEEF